MRVFWGSLGVAVVVAAIAPAVWSVVPIAVGTVASMRVWRWFPS